MHRMPVFHDDQSFSDRTDRMFREMQEKMGFHSLNDPSWSKPSVGWSTPSYNPRFFDLWPTTGSTAVGQSQLDSGKTPFEILDDVTTQSLFVDLDQGQGRDGDGRLFRMSFDMRQYDPADISVRSENDCLVVEAKHDDDKNAANGATSVAGQKVSRQFSRRIQLPAGVDPMKLTSTLSADNILTVQAPVPPDYNAVVNSLGTSSTKQQQQLRSSPTPHGGFQPSTIQYQQPQSAQLQAPLASMTTSGRVSPRLGAIVIQPTPSPSPSLNVPTFTVDQATGRRRLDLAVELGPPYTADDVAVRLEGRRLTVDAKHENRDESRGRVSSSSTQKQFDLGEDVDPATIQASMSDGGRLTIVAYVK